MRKISCVLFLVFCFGNVVCMTTEQDEKLSKTNQALIEAKRQKIETEIAQLKDHPWAGQYYFGDGLGANVSLTLAPENGFTITWYGCLGLYDQNHGTVDWDKDRNTLKMSFAFEVEKGYIGRYASEYKPIRWGERVYLISANEIVQFCNDINSGREPRKGVHGQSFLRRGDEKKEAEGKPVLPEEFMPYLLDEPIDAAIVSVKDVRETRDIIDSRVFITTVFINKGKKDGLAPGMELYVMEPKNLVESMKLTKVVETQSEGEFRIWECRGLRTPTPAEGWQLSTRPSWWQDVQTAEKTEAVQDTKGDGLLRSIGRSIGASIFSGR